MQAIRRSSGDTEFAALCIGNGIIPVLMNALPSQDEGISKEAVETLLALAIACPEVSEEAIRCGGILHVYQHFMHVEVDNLEFNMLTCS